MEPLIIMVMACATIPKYRNYILKIEETWAQRARELGIKVIYFLGEEPTHLVGPQYVYLDGVGNDYYSASDKQNLGLQYLYDHFNAKFVYCCGSDTYINVDKVLGLLDQYDWQERLFIGGHIIARTTTTTTTTTTQRSLISFSGGGGLLISRALMGAMYHEFTHMMTNWTQLVTTEGCSYLAPACDVCLGYYAQQYQGHLICYQDCFTGCNHRGEPNCCLHKARCDRLMACHNMSLADFEQFHQILVEHNYFTKNDPNPNPNPITTTLIMTCFSQQQLSRLSASPELIKNPNPIVIYCSNQVMEPLIKLRDAYGLTHQTVYYNLPYQLQLQDTDQLVERIIKINPFGTDKFQWIENYI